MKEKNANFWHAMECDCAESALRTNQSKGLSAKEVTARRLKCGENAIWRVQKTSAAHAFFGESLNLTAILLIITALSAAVFKHRGEAAALIVILTFSGIIRCVTYIIAHRIFEEAARTNIPKASVLRKGKIRTISADSVVPGDILLFSVGDPVVADVRLLDGALTVSELGVTANRDVQHKSAARVLSPEIALEDRTNVLFAGSTVLGGTARGVAFATGEKTYIFAKRGYISVPAGENLSVLSRLSSWCRNVSLFMIAAVLIITLGGLFVGKNTVSIDLLLLSALSLAVASMSEFLSVIAAIILAVSVQRLRAKSNGGTVIRSAESIETFGHAQCIIFGDIRLFQTGETVLCCTYTNGFLKTHATDDLPADALHLIALSILCRNGSLHPLSAGASAVCDELTEMTCAVYEKYALSMRENIKLPPVIATKCDKSFYTVLTDSGNGTMCYVCGALSDVLSVCTTQRIGTDTVPFGPTERKKLLDSFKALSFSNSKTIAVAMRPSPNSDLSRTSVLQNKMTFLGFFAVTDPTDPALKQWVQKAKSGGYRLLTLLRTPDVELPLAVEAGLTAPDTPVLTDFTSIEAFARGEIMSEDSGICIAAVDEATREKIIRTVCKHMPHTVYVGNTLRDIPLFNLPAASIAAESLHEKTPQCLCSAADASVSVKGKRTSAAVEAFHIIAAAKSALLHIRRATEYLLTVQALRLTLMLSAAFFGAPLLSPAEVLWCGLIIDFFAVLNLAFIPHSCEILSKRDQKIDLPSAKNGIIFPLLCGILIGFVLSLLAVFAITRCAVENALPIVYIGNIFTSILAFVFCIADCDGVRNIRVSSVLIVYILLLCITLISAGHTGTPIAFLFALTPCILFPLMKVIYKHANKF